MPQCTNSKRKTCKGEHWLLDDHLLRIYKKPRDEVYKHKFFKRFCTQKIAAANHAFKIILTYFNCTGWYFLLQFVKYNDLTLLWVGKTKRILNKCDTTHMYNSGLMRNEELSISGLNRSCSGNFSVMAKSKIQISGEF